MLNFIKIRPFGAQFHVDGWTDMMKLLFMFYNSANTPKNCRVTRSIFRKWLLGICFVL